MLTETLRMVYSHFCQDQLQLIHVQAMKWMCSCLLHLYQIRQESYILLTPVAYGLVQYLWAKQCNSQIHYIQNWRSVNYKALWYNQTNCTVAEWKTWCCEWKGQWDKGSDKSLRTIMINFRLQRVIIMVCWMSHSPIFIWQPLVFWNTTMHHLINSYQHSELACCLHLVSRQSTKCGLHSSRRLRQCDRLKRQ